MDLLPLFSGIISLIIAYIIYSRNKHYLGNQLLAIAYVGYSFFGFGFFRYELATSLTSVVYSLRYALIGLILANCFIICAIMVFTHSEQFFKRTKSKFIPMILSTICLVVIWIPNTIVGININPTQSIRTPIVMFTLGGYTLLTVISNTTLLTKAIKKMSDETIKNKLSKLRLGILMFIGVVVFAILENLTQNIAYMKIQHLFIILSALFSLFAFIKDKNQ